MEITSEKIFTVKDLALFSKVSIMTIQRWTNEGKLPETRNKNGWRIYDFHGLVEAKKLAKKTYKKRAYKRRTYKEELYQPETILRKE